jgi:hypothetical protein
MSEVSELFRASPVVWNLPFSRYPYLGSSLVQTLDTAGTCNSGDLLFSRLGKVGHVSLGCMPRERWRLTLLYPALSVAGNSPSDFIVPALSFWCSSEAVFQLSVCDQRKHGMIYAQGQDGVDVRVVHFGWDVCVPFWQGLGV